MSKSTIQNIIVITFIDLSYFIVAVLLRIVVHTAENFSWEDFN